MKLIVLGPGRMSGSKAGRDYDFCQLRVLQPVESRSGTTKAGDPYRADLHGVEQGEIPLDEAARIQFTKIAASEFPLELDLLTDSRIVFGKLETVVVGIAGSPVAAAPRQAAAG